ncbi:AMP-binding protein [Streptomyces sp. NPDC087290]|uniref:AMP-binding protein n=1 Tax=Streptomyces sp. NPDC087290 TaxID=3365776 RepID=UPI00382DD278
MPNASPPPSATASAAEGPDPAEHVLAEHPGIAQVAVVTLAHRTGGAPERIAVLVPADRPVPLAELRDHLAARSPSVPPPGGFRWLPALPSGPGGEIDREALRRSLDAWSRRGPGTAPAEPDKPRGTPLAQLWWAELRHTGREGADRTGFLTLGGHSLLAVRLRARISEELRVDVPLRTFMSQNVSLAELEGFVAAAPRTAGAPDPGARPDGRDAGEGPLAPGQRRLHVLSHVMKDPAAYNVVGALRLVGKPDRTLLDAALADVVRRHDLLGAEITGLPGNAARIRYGRPVSARWEITTGTEAEADAFALRIAGTVIPLDGAPLFRAGVLECTDSAAAYLVLSIHHLISDQHSLDLMFADLATAYTARADETGRPLEAAPSFAAHALREAEAASRGRPDELEFWKERLGGVPEQAPLPFAPRPSDVPDATGQSTRLVLNPALSDRIDALLKEHRATPATLLLACVGLVLSAWTSQDTVVLGMPASTRRTRDEQDLFGFLLTTLPIRLDLADRADFASLLRHTAERYLEAYEHGAATFETIVDALGMPSGPRANPLFTVWVNDVTHGPEAPCFGALATTRHELPAHAALFDLNFYLRRTDGYRLELVHAVDRVGADIARELLRQVGHVLTHVLEAPGTPLGDVRLAPGAGPGTAPGPAPARRAGSLLDAVRDRAARTPDAPAIERDSRTVLSYRELLARTEASVERFAAAGVVRGDVVEIAARRTPELPVALLATWATGAVAALVDAGLPAARIQEQRAALRPRWTVDTATLGGPPGPAAAEQGCRLPGAGHVLFTSGSTGRPAAVAAPEGVLEAALAQYADAFAPSPDDRVALLAGLGHDPLLRDLFVPLTAGGTLVLPPDDVFRSPDRISSFLREARITVLHATPALLELVVAGADGLPLPALHTVVCGGAPLTAGLVRRLRRVTGARVVNAYGATETPQIASCETVAGPAADPDGSLPDRAVLPVGDGFGDTRLLVVDDRGRPVETGRRGHIVVQGPRLALGYIGEADRSHRFAPPGEHGERRFHTGDLGRRDPRGRVHVEGRSDRQFLVDGFRVAPEEIEHGALRDPAVAQCLAALEATPAGRLLTLYVVPDSDAVVDPARLRAHLRRHLPAHAVPAVVHAVRRLGMDHNHKVTAVGSVVRTPPPKRPARATAAHAELAGLAREVLGRELSDDENFFDAGLTSIGLVRLHELLRERLGVDLPVTELFARPTLGRLAAVLRPSPDRTPARRTRARRENATAERTGYPPSAPHRTKAVPGLSAAARRRLDIRRHLYQDTGEPT